MRLTIFTLLILFTNSLSAQFSFDIVKTVVGEKTWEKVYNLDPSSDGYVLCLQDTNRVIYLDHDLKFLKEEFIEIKPRKYFESEGRKVFTNGYQLLIDGELVEIRTRYRGGFYYPVSFDHTIVGDKILVRRKPGIGLSPYNATEKQLQKEFDSRSFLTVYDFKGKIQNTFVRQDSTLHFNRQMAWAFTQVPFGEYIPSLETYFSNSPYYPTIRKYSIDGEYLGEFGVWPKESNRKPFEMNSYEEELINGARGFVESDFYGIIHHDLEHDVLLRFFKYAEQDTTQLDSSYTNYIRGLKDADYSGVKKKDRPRCVRPNPAEEQQWKQQFGRKWHLQVYDPLSGELIDEFEPEFESGGKRFVGVNSEGLYVFSHEEDGELVLEFVRFSMN